MIEATLKDSWAEAAPNAAPDAARPALWLRRLTVTNFRSYGSAELTLDARPLVFTGANGAGKTNLLEAVSLLGPGRGLRGARPADLEHRTVLVDQAPGDRKGPVARGWSVAAEVMTPEGARSLGTGREAPQGENGGLEGSESNGRERRLLRLDGAPAKSQAALATVLRLIWLTPQMDGLFREPAQGRRRFLDRLVTAYDPDHAGRIQAYEHSMRERARLLKGGFEDIHWLSSLEDSMARRGVAIAAARRDLVARLNRAVAAGVGPFPAVALALDCGIDSQLGSMAALAVEDDLRRSLAECRQQDTENGGAAVGPHRADLTATHLGKGLPAPLCSTGEQKALLTALVLSHVRLMTLEGGAVPVLLLDELAAHFDDERRAALFDEILALGAQAWITGTDSQIFASLGGRAQHFEVGDGRILPAAGNAQGVRDRSGAVESGPTDGRGIK